MSRPTERPLEDLLAAVPAALVPESARRVRVRGVVGDARQVEPGMVYVAIPGTRVDGHDFVEHAVSRGARAIVAERDLPIVDVPVIRVPHAREAMALVAGEWHGRPAAALQLVGITGTLGKTTVLSMLQAVMDGTGRPIGSIGSLGIRYRAWSAPTRHTTPDPLALHRALGDLRGRGADVVAMEVTSHALDQRRVHGLRYDLGIFTSLALLEHVEYHGSFRRYVEAKIRFFNYLRRDAPLVYPVGDRAVGALVRGRAVEAVSCGPGGRASIRIDRLRLGRGGTRIILTIPHPIPRLDGRPVGPVSFPIELRVLGRPNVGNAALAGTAALLLGAAVEEVQEALAAFPAPWRRTQLIHHGRFMVLDDSVAHPSSISALFEVAERIRPRRVHVVFAIRGRRGAEINRRDAEAIAIWSRRVPIATLVATSSDDAVSEANRVEREERDAFLDQLRHYGLRHEYRNDLTGAIRTALDRVGRGDLLLLLGAQGMDQGAERLRRLPG